MMRRILLLPLLGCLPGLLFAADQALPRCQTDAPADTAFVPLEADTLDHQQRDELRRLFRDLAGNWQGSLQEQVCMLSGATRQHAFTASLRLQASASGLVISGDYTELKGGAKRRFKRALLLTSDGLRVDHRSAVGEVELDQADLNGLRYVQRFRTVHTLPQAAKADAGGGQTSGGSAGQQTGSGQTDSQTAEGVTAVAGSGNVVSGEPATDPKKPAPVRRSQIREERFSLQRQGSSRLLLRQDHYTQGVYTGSMVWELRRH